ncbi:Hypothetical predicted protein, partial [Paramuricea clavata]
MRIDVSFLLKKDETGVVVYPSKFTRSNLADEVSPRDKHQLYFQKKDLHNTDQAETSTSLQEIVGMTYRMGCMNLFLVYIEMKQPHNISPCEYLFDESKIEFSMENLEPLPNHVHAMVMITWLKIDPFLTISHGDTE